MSKPEIKYLSLDELIIIHEQAIGQFGGSHGIRDLGLVQSAIARPMAGFGNFEAYPDIFLKAAVLMHSLLKNHAFIDGNKRTAMIAGLTFVMENNIQLVTKKDEIFNLALNIENDSLPEDQIASWLKKHSVKVL